MMKMFLSILLLSFLLSACGLKGPLYAPDKHTATLMFTSPFFYRVA
ncbi:LPS translocon maturation chaperone LptM [Orbus sasakiae]